MMNMHTVIIVCHLCIGSPRVHEHVQECLTICVQYLCAKILSTETRSFSDTVCLLLTIQVPMFGHMHYYYYLLLFSTTEELSELKMYELKTSGVLTVCQQLVLTAFKYPNQSDVTCHGHIGHVAIYAMH